VEASVVDTAVLVADSAVDMVVPVEASVVDTVVPVADVVAKPVKKSFQSPFLTGIFYC